MLAAQELEVEMELEYVLDDYEIYEAPRRLALVPDDDVEIEYVVATEDDGWFLASEEVIAATEDLPAPERRPRWPYVIAAGLVVALAASVVVSI